MKYVQINSFYNGSTGTIMRNLHRDLQEQGVDSYIFWGRRHESINEHEQCCASKLGVYSHGARARLTGRAGFYSKRDTKNLLKRLDAIKPDIVHLHNIHGYYINVEMLFDWLNRNNVEVIWTLHDCWSFTGHCAYFSYVKCTQWKRCCALNEICPQMRTYPRTIAKDAACRWSFEHKKIVFTSIARDRMTLIAPSLWLANLIAESFMDEYSVEVRHNKVDSGAFNHRESAFRIENGLESKFIILGVASPWTERKGLKDFIEVAKRLDERFSIVLVGLTKKQIKEIPDTLRNMILPMKRTESNELLADIYSAADVVFNPTYEDNYPSIILESESCGTPVITYDTGGCKEALKNPKSLSILTGDVAAFVSIMQGRINE